MRAHGTTRPLAALVAVIAGLVLAAAAAAGEPDDVRLISAPVIEGLNLPTTLAQAPDGRVFIGEKAGRILEWTPGSATARTVIDLSPTGLDIVQADKDRGVLGLAADPGFDDPASPGFRRLYVSFQSRFGPVDDSGVNGPLQPAQDCSLTICPTVGRLGAVRVDDAGQATEVELISQNWCGEQPAHAIGDIEWTNDREALLVAAGDGITSRGPGGWDAIGNPCGVPAGFDSPLKAQQAFAGIAEPGFEGAVVSYPLARLRDPSGSQAPRIVAAGFRNPWRMALDDATGDVYVANVGWNTYEEIDRIPASSVASGPAPNHGWPCAEGPETFEVTGWSATAYCQAARSGGTLTAPWLYYGATDGPPVIVTCSQGRAVGPVEIIRDDAPLPAGTGSGLFFADYVRGCGWIARREPGAALTPGDIRLVSAAMPSITDALQADDGTLYWTQILSDDFAGPGKVNRLTTGVVAKIDVTHAARAGESATVSGAGSLSSLADPTLSYAWDLDGDRDFDDATGPDARVVINEPRVISLRATDQFGRSDQADAEVRVGTAPEVTIDMAPATGVVRPGTRVRASVGVTDIDADADPASTRWAVQIRHCQATCHTHPVLSDTGASIEFTAEAHAEGDSGGDTYLYRVIARNTDRAGLVGVASRDVRVAEPDAGPGEVPGSTVDRSPQPPPAVPAPPVPPAPPPACRAATTAPPSAVTRRGMRLTAALLVIDQRIAQAAMRRVNALAARVQGRPEPPSRRRAAGRVTLSVAQLRINQAIARVAVRRVNALAARIEGRGTPAAREPATRRSLALSARQVLINQRISRAALTRVGALERCLAPESGTNGG